MTIGENIKARRLALGMSQQALADKTGYATRGAINKVENGSVDVNQTKIKLFANALKCTPADLFENEKAPTIYKKGVIIMTIGERIKSRREELGMSQDELAKKLGYKSRSSINKIELGQRELRQKNIMDIANALNTTPSYVMGWDRPDSENEDMKKAVEEILKSIPTEKREEFLQYIKITAKLFENKEMI